MIWPSLHGPRSRPRSTSGESRIHAFYFHHADPQAHLILSKNTIPSTRKQAYAQDLHKHDVAYLDIPSVA